MIALSKIALRTCLAALLLVPSANVIAASAALPSPTRADCDRPEWQQVLRPADPATAPAAAEAAWLDGRTLRWPGPTLSPGDRVEWVVQRPGQADEVMALQAAAADPASSRRAPHIADGPTWQVPTGLSSAMLRALHRSASHLRHVAADGTVRQRTEAQAALALDDLFGTAASDPRPLGATLSSADGSAGRTTFRVWAPTAQRVWLCLHADTGAPARALVPMQFEPRTGLWQHTAAGRLQGQAYTYLADVAVRGTGWVRNRVTDPYATALATDSVRTVVADLDDPALMPAGWRTAPSPHGRAPHPVDMVIYELHVRDFSVSDDSVPEAHRGKYLGFTHETSRGMQHLSALSKAGLTDVHLLPVFDLATVPETGCVTPKVDPAPPDSDRPQAQVMAAADRDCFNWGYDPWHFNAPEGSYAVAPDGLSRIVEFRQMVLALHRAGLRVGMDVVYNHTTASGQREKSVLDRIVPGYYQRLNARGAVETSTCCDNTATEHRMMARLMLDSLELWARHYRIDSFRFDLMGHQPRDAMVAAQQRLRRALGREIHFIGEGWNFGEVANNARFRQASQRELGGTGIATFSDRGRDAVRGGGHDDSGTRLVSRQGWLNGLHHAPNALGGEATRAQLMAAADQVRVGLAGTLRSVELTAHDGRRLTLEQLRYHDQPAGYVTEPAEVVNYVDNHDNQTLFDINALRLPRDTSREDRARVQVLGIALTAFSQGVAYFHAGVETLRSKSLDRNSYDSGDWFNVMDWTLQDNGFARGLPPQRDNAASWDVMRPVLADPGIKPQPEHIRWTRDAFIDLLRIRASTPLLRLRTAAEVRQRLTWLNTGPSQEPTVMAVLLDGRDLPGAGFQAVATFVNASREPQRIPAPEARGRAFELHPVHRAAGAADARARQATFDAARNEFTIPARTAVAFVLR